MSPGSKTTLFHTPAPAADAPKRLPRLTDGDPGGEKLLLGAGRSGWALLAEWRP